MSNQSNISREEMRLYLEGKLKGTAAHKVERYILEHSFEKEAMDGFEHFDQEEIDADLIQLSHRMNHRKTSFWSFYYVAAAVTLLVVASGVVWMLTNQISISDEMAYRTKENTIRSREFGPEPEEGPNVPEIPIQEKTLADYERIESSPESRNTTQKGANKQAEASKKMLTITVIQQEKAEVVRDSVEEIQINTSNLSQTLQGKVAGVSIRDEEDEGSATDEMVLQEVIVERSAPTMRKALTGSSTQVLREADQSVPHTISGQVTDASGLPIPGVIITISGTKKGTLSDLDGYYQLDVESIDELEYSFVGYESVVLRVGSRDTLDIELEPDLQALSEVVVVGYGISGRTEALTYQSARPVEGMKHYKEYLAKALRYPNEAIDNVVEGNVILKVTIVETGAIGNIEIRRSLGFGCDQEAIRLVKEGPQWEPSEKDGLAISSQVRIKIKFQLSE